jgi:hypothetical protein
MAEALSPSTQQAEPTTSLGSSLDDHLFAFGSLLTPEIAEMSGIVTEPANHGERTVYNHIMREEPRLLFDLQTSFINAATKNAR